MQLDPKYPLELIAYLVVNPLTANLFPPAPFSALTNHQSDNRTYVCKPKKIPVLMIWITTESSKKRKKKNRVKTKSNRVLVEGGGRRKAGKGSAGSGIGTAGAGSGGRRRPRHGSNGRAERSRRRHISVPWCSLLFGLHRRRDVSESKGFDLSLEDSRETRPSLLAGTQPENTSSTKGEWSGKRGPGRRLGEGWKGAAVPTRTANPTCLHVIKYVDGGSCCTEKRFFFFFFYFFCCNISIERCCCRIKIFFLYLPSFLSDKFIHQKIFNKKYFDI